MDVTSSDSPPRRCVSSAGGAIASTPPKTPMKSPGRVAQRSRSPPDHRHGEAACSSGMPAVSSACGLSGAPLPFAVCEAVTSALWAYGKAHAEKAAREKSAGSVEEPGTACSSGGQQPSSVHHTAHISPPFTAPTQSQEEMPSTPVCEEAMIQARLALNKALEQIGSSDTYASMEVLGVVRSMALTAMAFWREVSQDLGKAASNLARLLEQQRRLYWCRPAWRGVNLGGWLLCEPGPSAELFQKYGPRASCEWQLCQEMHEHLGVEGTRAAFKLHREKFVTEDDIRRIRALGLNAVRVPFGYWAVLGPTEGDFYDGPCLEYLDRVVMWCERHGLQVLLDLHGAPGGESGCRACGRENKDWSWKSWRFDDSIAALRLIASRYKGQKCVTGISVCNEPSEQVPVNELCRFFDRAVRTIREAGMPPDEVAVVLSIFRTERLDQVWQCWVREFDGFVRYANVAFDLHFYHCFGSWWARQGLGAQLRMTKRHRKILRRVPAVVGEWSLALNDTARRGESREEEDQALQAFGAAQLEAYSQASHGWFFWNWRDNPNVNPPVWDMRKCIERRWLLQAAGSSANLKLGG
eukprot:gnl/TRDRNA2_/TRDRNA2_186904_c0_seq1.p1 gnl/TRDRNA2_/TRDRNA2_186904_c0~~gnl/TRDRNA2_/TRDRNA2_186904_c0_seq1.p1  ORF type:complete len:581 (+),score=86.80 gnl/TRDRNA2_/TRDRNA2_186904_c0_seq1:107-1849(+)